MPSVSVLLLTYNADPAQVRRALTAIAGQKEVALEVIISDDGSVKKDFSFLPDFMERVGLQQWKLLEHPNNRGTVCSCLSAAEAATGEYVFTTSPGDFLFDEYVLRDFYRFAREQDCAVCFGNAVYYSAESGKPVLSQRVGRPLRPQYYAPKVPDSYGKTAFFAGDWVVGACYFRRLPEFRECLQTIAGKVVYAEDTPTTMFLMAQGQRLCYYDRNMVWYEHGTGVSTSGSSKWNLLIREDIHSGYRLLKEQFPQDPYIDYAQRHGMETSNLRRLAGNLLRHFDIMLRLRLLRRTSPKQVSCTDEDWERLAELLKIQ